MCAQMNFPGLDGSTSSQESADGPRPSELPAGPQTFRSGPEALVEGVQADIDKMLSFLAEAERGIVR